MAKRFIVSENEKENIRKMYLMEDDNNEDRKFCHGGNVKTLDEIVGDDEYEDYVEGIKVRKNGINALVDKLELLKVIRNIDGISDGGENLAFGIMNDLKAYKPYNYFDETKKECNKAMDKIIELYKENEHGEELVKDIEKVYALSHLNPRAKEFLKHSINMIKGI
jgi:hypothetical protein